MQRIQYSVLYRNYFVLFTYGMKSARTSWVTAGFHQCGYSFEMCFLMSIMILFSSELLMKSSGESLSNIVIGKCKCGLENNILKFNFSSLSFSKGDHRIFF